ncbi:KpsF/GutQ family sugar-phosphate isomerase [Holophaga foetida]|uniref:KpsF/GutQ family sugar-phosphate isomerase n=1 Tax=Holophaga foetida TaxID=35839 RepID=UPI0002473ABE|nr:KpsF/GutQ family sugar-phosphate isomerase [Holophaga foetida]
MTMPTTDQTLDDSTPEQRRDAALQVLKAASSAVALLQESLDTQTLESWTGHLLRSKGRVVLSGVGKSGLIARKISATLASTGCPSLFIHPGDALHGDLGMVTPDDTVLLLSNSGETEEVLRLLPSLIRLGVEIGAITSKASSRLGQAAKWCFPYQLPEGEGCPLDFAPMASTTLQLIWGDILAAHRMVSSGFTRERFATFHPGGALGAKLLKCSDLMHTDAPAIVPEATLTQSLAAMTSGKLGMTTVLRDGQLMGVVSDGDIRRALERAEKSGINPLKLRAEDLMTPSPISVPPTMMAIEASRIFETRKITFLIVQDASGKLCGVLHVHDLLGAKVI